MCAIALSDAGLLRREMLDELIDPEVALRYLRAKDVDTSRLERGLAEEISKNALWQAGLLRLEALNEAMDPDVAIGLLKANHLDTSPLEQYLADLHGGGGLAPGPSDIGTVERAKVMRSIRRLSIGDRRERVETFSQELPQHLTRGAVTVRVEV